VNRPRADTIIAARSERCKDMPFCDPVSPPLSVFGNELFSPDWVLQAGLGDILGAMPLPSANPPSSSGGRSFRRRLFLIQRLPLIIWLPQDHELGRSFSIRYSCGLHQLCFLMNRAQKVLLLSHFSLQQLDRSLNPSVSLFLIRTARAS